MMEVGWKLGDWLEMARNGWEDQKWLGVAGMAGSGWNGWKWLEMDRDGWKWLECMEIAGNGWNCLNG